MSRTIYEVYGELLLQSEYDTKVYISSPHVGFIAEVELKANIGQTLRIRKDSLVANLDDMLTKGTGKYSNGIHIESDRPISVTNTDYNTFPLLPSHLLDKKYLTGMIGDYYWKKEEEENPRIINEISILATRNDTKIEISNLRWVEGLKFQEPNYVTLNEGEVFHIESEGDLSTTWVKVVEDEEGDCKDIAVFVRGALYEGEQWHCSWGATPISQVPPVASWGTTYILPMIDHIGPVAHLKIFASEDGTVVEVEGQDPVSIDSGINYRFDFPPAGSIIKSNKPIMVIMYKDFEKCDNDRYSDRDPYMSFLRPMQENMLRKMNLWPWDTVSADLQQHYFSQDQYPRVLSLITYKDSVDGVLFDGEDISDQFDIRGDYAYLSMEYELINHQIIAPHGAMMFVHADSVPSFRSYGYHPGGSYDSFDREIIFRDSTGTVLTDMACINSEVTMAVEFELMEGQVPAYNHFEWDFGDGTTATGQTAKHTYDKVGTYTINLAMYDARLECSYPERYTRQLTIIDPNVGWMTGSSSVCPGLQGIRYSVEDKPNNTYEWIVPEEFGEIVSGQTTSSIVVNWFETPTEDAYVSVVPVSILGCRGDMVSIDVKINPILNPDLPIGNSDVCATDMDKVFSYRAFQKPGSTYQWELEGGEFVPSGADTGAEVMVRWFGTQHARLRYFEENNQVDVCSGWSEYLEISFTPELQATAEIIPPSCFGGNDGTIRLHVTGGKAGEYTAVWSNGLTGLDVTGFSEGTYEARITDATGCELIKTFEMRNPEKLVIENVEVIDALCYQEASGRILIGTSGGTIGSGFTYMATNNQYEVTSQSSDISGLMPGVYVVTVIDPNGCVSIKEDIEVGQPEILGFDLNTFVNNSICEDATANTYIEAKGGTPDYQIYWSNNPDIDSNSGSEFQIGSYSVRVVDSMGCEKSMNFDVNEREPRLYVSNAFSPNGDGINDEFKPVLDCANGYYMQIFNRWGGLLFSTYDISKGWDGTFESEGVPEDVYSYIIFYSGEIDRRTFEETHRGRVKLIR